MSAEERPDPYAAAAELRRLADQLAGPAAAQDTQLTETDLQKLWAHIETMAVELADMTEWLPSCRLRRAVAEAAGSVAAAARAAEKQLGEVAGAPSSGSQRR